MRPPRRTRRIEHRTKIDSAGATLCTTQSPLLLLAAILVFFIPFALDSGVLELRVLKYANDMWRRDPNGDPEPPQSAAPDSGEPAPDSTDNDEYTSNEANLRSELGDPLFERDPEGLLNETYDTSGGDQQWSLTNEDTADLREVSDGPRDTWDAAGAASRVSRAGLGHLYEAGVQPALTTRTISWYRWPTSNITAILDELEPPPPGMDAQVWRDFRPWRGRRISIHDLESTRNRHTSLLTERTPFSHEIFTTVIKEGVPYYLVSEMKALSSYKPARLLKLLDFVLQLHSVGKRFRLPDVHLIWTVLPNPLLPASSARDLVHAPAGVAPILSLCKTEHHLDVLYPNMYFRTMGWWSKVTARLHAASLSMPFAGRKSKLWWRGNSGTTWPAARPRVVTVASWFSRSWADFAFTNQWSSVVREWKAKPRYATHIPRNHADIPFGSSTRAPIQSVARYKYTLHLPGSFSGTYSRALQFLLWTGSAIFVYDCPYFEFYYHHLQPWQHYIPVNAENLGERMEWAARHQAVVEGITLAAKAAARTYVTPEYISLYWKQLLDEYAALQRFDVQLPKDACTCWRGNQDAPPPGLPRSVKRCPHLCDAIVYLRGV